jgi:hypothetical protein
LLGGLNVNEVLIWPPDLFAYSSYILMVKTILKTMPPLTLACWAYLSRAIKDGHFCNGQKLNLGDLLCNQDHLQLEPEYCRKLWRVSQSVLTLHAISDLASLRFGIDADTSRSPAMTVAEKLLLGKYPHIGSTSVGGTLSTVLIV